jgi:hypothetical protein
LGDHRADQPICHLIAADWLRRQLPVFGRCSRKLLRHLCKRERDFLGELHGERGGVRSWAETGVPAMEVCRELIVEDPGADLKEPRAGQDSLVAVI